MAIFSPDGQYLWDEHGQRWLPAPPKPVAPHAPSATAPDSVTKVLPKLKLMSLRNTNRSEKLGASALGVLVLVALVGGLMHKSGEDSIEERDAGYVASVMNACKEATSSRLKSPGSAQWHLNQIDNAYEEVTGSVDSQNGFGASLRTSVECKANPNAGGTAVVYRLHLNGSSVLSGTATY